MLKSKLVSPSQSPDLESEKLDSTLDSFARKPRSFGVRAVAECWGAGSNLDSVHDKLIQDRRFLRVDGHQIENAYFISDESLFHWMAQLNLRLAQDSVATLSWQEFVNELKDLSDQATWELPPEEVLNFGSRYGLVSTANADDQYSFPLAWVLSRVSPTVLREVAEALHAFEDLDTRFWWLNRSIDEAVEESLANFPENEATVVRGREDLSGEGRLILQELGRRLNLTRERVRQLEARFWWRLTRPSLSNKSTSSRKWTIASVELRHACISAFLANFMRTHGSLVVANNSIQSKLILFCARCMGLPIEKVQKTDDIVIGARPSDLTMLGDLDWNTKYHLGEYSVSCPVLTRSLPLVMADLHLIAVDASRAWMNHAPKMRKVSLALGSIGRPAHYSEIAITYNSMFPEDQMKERNIHAILTRKRCGVVSTGHRGTYALMGGGEGPMPD